MATPPLPTSPPAGSPAPPGAAPPPSFNTTTAPVYAQTNDTPDVGQTITVTDLPPLTVGAPTPIVPEMLGPTPYWDGQIDGRYDADMGILQMPVGGPAGTNAEIIRVHAPCETRVMEWTAQRLGAKPRAPSTVTNNPSEVLLTRTVFPMTQHIMPDGQLLYRLSGRYEYACFLPHAETDYLSAGVPSWSAQSPSQTNVEPVQWDQTLLNAAETIPAGFVPPTN